MIWAVKELRCQWLCSKILIRYGLGCRYPRVVWFTYLQLDQDSTSTCSSLVVIPSVPRLSRVGRRVSPYRVQRRPNSAVSQSEVSLFVNLESQRKSWILETLSSRSSRNSDADAVVTRWVVIRHTFKSTYLLLLFQLPDVVIPSPNIELLTDPRSLCQTAISDQCCVSWMYSVSGLVAGHSVDKATDNLRKVYKCILSQIWLCER